MIDNNKMTRLGFTNIDGKHFSNIRETKFIKEEGKSLNLGNFIACSGGYDSDDYSNLGVVIYQNEMNPNIGFRIYNEFASPGFNGYRDEYLISKLQEKQKNIKLTDFPYGVATLNGRVIGQEIPIYPGSCNLHQYVNKLGKQLQFDSYYNIISILKELEENEIYYYDLHYRNFMINKINKKINTIDFEPSLVSTEKSWSGIQKMVLMHLRTMIIILNKDSLVDKKLLLEKEWRSLEEAEEKIYEFVLKQQVG